MAEAKTTVNKFDIQLTPSLATVPNTTVWDTSFCLSKLNHRLYRQGRQYTVKVDAHNDTFVSDESYDVFALMPSWSLRSAWRMAKKAYDQAMKDELETLSPANVARWRDFRVGSGIRILTTDTDALANGGTAPTQYRLGNTNSAAASIAFTAGEYNLSYAHNLETGVNMNWWLAQGNATNFGIMEEYSLSRNESASPETVISTMPYEALLAEGEDADYEEVQANGNEPPYNANVFPNNIWVRVGVLAKDTESSRMTTGFFPAPLGIVAVRPSKDTGNTGTEVSITVKEGDYHGVHAPSM